MKQLIFTFVLIVVVASAATAQTAPGGINPYANMQNMKPEDMQNMMQNAQAMQACFAKIGPAPMQWLQKETQKMKAEIVGLCQAGKRDEAMSAAIEKGKALSENEEMKKIMECGQMAQSIMATMPFREYVKPQNPNSKPVHVCEAMLQPGAL